MSDNLEEYELKLKDHFSAPLAAAEKATGAFRETFGGLAGILGGALAGIGIAEFVKSSIEAFNESEQGFAQVRAGIESTSGAAGRSFEDLKKQAESLQKTTLFSDDEIMSGVTSQLLSFTNIAGEQFDRTQIAAADLATRLGGDLQGAAIQLGKALNDPAHGLSMLGKSGRHFSDSQKAVIEGLQKSGHLAQAQNLILDELQKQYGGSAAAAAKAGTGGIKQFANSVNDTQERIGEFFMTILSDVLPALQAMNDGFNDLMTFVSDNAVTFEILIGAVAGGIAAFAAYSAVMKTGAVVTGIMEAATAGLNFVMSMNPIGVVVVAIGALIAAVVVAYRQFDAFRATILGVWAAIKTFADNVVHRFTEIPKIILNAFEGIPRAIFNSLKGIGNIIGAIATGNFAAVPDMLKELGLNMLKSNPLTGAAVELAKGTGDAFNNAFSDEMTKSAAAKAAKEKAGQNAAAGLGQKKVGSASPASVGSGLSSITAAAPKVFNINIEKLIETLKFETNNLSESKLVIRDEVTKVLLAAVNDSQVIAE